MQLNEKINLKKYSLLSVLLLGASYFLSRNLSEYLAICVVFFAVVLNQWMLFNSVQGMINATISNESESGLNTIFSFLFKAIILIAAITFGVHIMGNRVIIPILIYIAQIFILYISMNKKD